MPHLTGRRGSPETYPSPRAASAVKKQGAYTDIINFEGTNFPPGRSLWVFDIASPIGYPLIPSNFVVSSSFMENLNFNLVILSTKITGDAQITVTILNLENDEVGGSYFFGIEWQEAIDI